MLLAAGSLHSDRCKRPGRLIKKSLDGDMMMLDTITKNKRRIIGLLIIVVTVCVLILLVARHNRRANARAEADRIISGEQQATEEQIHEIIRRFMAGKKWVLDITTQDGRRLKQLLDIRGEIRKSRNYGVAPMIRARADSIIAGERPASETALNVIIVSLQCTTAHAQRTIDQDLQRVKRLRDMCDEMQKSLFQPPHPPFDPNWSTGSTRSSWTNPE